MFRLIKMRRGRRNQKLGVRIVVSGSTYRLVYVPLYSKSLQYKSERVVTARFDRSVFCYLFLANLKKYKSIHAEMYTGMFSGLHFRNFVAIEASYCRQLKGTHFYAQG